MTTEIQIVDDSRLSFPSASYLPRYFACAGSFLAEKSVEEQAVQVDDSNRDSDRGTELHYASEVGDVSDLDEEGVKLVERARAIEEEVILDWIASTGHTMQDIEIIREQRIWVGQYSAQLDFLALNHANRSALVSDLKSGRLKVAPASKSWQIRGQAVAVFVKYEYAPIRTVIVQPLLSRQPVADYSNAHLNAARDRIMERLEYIKQPDLPRTAGTHCSFCRARHTCKEAKQSMSVTIGANFLNWNLLVPADKLKLWKAADLAEDCSALIKGHIRKELADNPESIPGLKIAPSQRPRKVTNVHDLAVLLVNTALPDTFTEEDRLKLFLDFLKRTKISVKDAVDFYKSHMPSGSKKEAEKFLAEFGTEFVTEGFRQGAITISEDET